MAEEQQVAESETKGKRRKWSWRRRLAWCGLACVVFALWLNGPGFRWIGGMALPRIGMQKGFVLEGSLWYGPTLKTFVWRQAETDTEVQGDRLQVRYRPLRFFRGGIAEVLESITLTNITAVIDQRAPVEEKPKDDEAKPFPLERLPQPKVFLENIDITVLQPEEQQLKLADLNLSLVKGLDGSVSWDLLELPNGVGIDKVKGSLAYQDRGIALTDMPLIDGLAIEQLLVDVTPDRRLDVDAALGVYGSSIAAAVTVGDSASLRMSEGRIDLAEALPAPTLQGEVTELDIAVEGMIGHWSEWQVTGGTTLSKIAYQEMGVNQVAVELNQDTNGPSARVVVKLDEENRLNLGLSAQPVRETDGLSDATWSVSVNPQAPKLSGWMTQEKLPATMTSLIGGLKFEGEGTTLKVMDGDLKIGQTKVSGWEVPAWSVSAETNDAGHVMALLGDERWIDGVVTLGKALDGYSGNVTIASDRLGALQPGVAEAAQIIGAAKVVWKGEGNLKDIASHQGTLMAEGTNVGPADANFPYQTDLVASYKGEAIQVERIELNTGDLKLQAQASLTKTSLSLSEIQLSQNADTWIHGRILLPLASDDGSIVERFWKATDPAHIELQSVPIPLQKLALLGGQEMDLEGTVEIQADMEGPPKSLLGDLVLTGRGMGVPQSEGGFPSKGHIDMKLTLGEGRLDLAGEIRYDLLKPITLAANVPLQLDDPVAVGQAPVTGSVKIPKTDLAFLTDYVPALRQINGDFSMDMQVSGTISQPNVSGEMLLAADVVTFTSDDLPRLENTKFRLKGTPSALVIEEGRTGFAGGMLGLSGGVKLDGEQGPELDLRLTAQQALLTRNDNMVVRSNGDIRVAGPWTAATVSGRIGLVESRYFQEIDLLPTNKQGASLPSSPMSVEKTYGTDSAPFKDWQINLQILTEEPFRVRTNLAASDIVIDLNLRGSGAEVYPEGFIDLSETYAQLPFSRLDLNNSYVRFSQETGFPGQLDIRGESQIRDYLTRVVVSGNANNFDYVLTSNPPLPDEEIMALLGTGTTREDLVGSGQAAASRAALLLFDKLWRKVAKKDWEDPNSMREKRLTFESGNVNARTGSPMTTARLRLTDHFSLTGDASLNGDIRGLLHYLFKF